MQIDLNDNVIILSYSNQELLPRQKSQLYFWGFTSVGDCILAYYNADPNILIEKLINYLDSNHLMYSLSPEIIDIIKINKLRRDDYSHRFKLAKDFKEGLFEENKYKQETKLVNNFLFRTLKEHQLKAYYHLSLLGNGANFSVPGSGKTSVILAHFEKLRLNNEVNVLFVVGPASCFGPWKHEFQVVLNREPKPKILSGGDINQRLNSYFLSSAPTEMFLTTFQTLANDKDYVIKLFNNKLVNAYFVVDEAHYIKRENGQWANAVLEISKFAKYRCALTGTPIPHSYSDLFNIFDFLWPDCNPISEEDKDLLVDYDKQNRQKEAKKLLEKKIGPLFYRVRKPDLNLKPQVFHDPIMINMNPKERQIYDIITKSIQEISKKDYLSNSNIIQRLQKGRVIRLRQCVSYPKLLLTAIENYSENEVLIESHSPIEKLITTYDQIEKPAKLIKLLEMIEEFNSSKLKIVIWTNFIGTVNLIEKSILEKGLNCKKIIGSVPTENSTTEVEETREKIISKFTHANSGLDILIANPAACAESISLHKTCHNAIYYDLSFNGAQYIQSLDRIHRVGGSEEIKANYYFLQYSDSIDPIILSNLKRKEQKMSKIIDKDYSICSLDMFVDDENADVEAYKVIFGNDAN